MKKILFSATVADHLYYFHLPYFKMFKEQGWKVDAAANGERELPFCDSQVRIPIDRSPLGKGNVQAYKILKKLIKENKYDIIHCHTPVGGMLTRLAAGRKSGSKVVYTAHGFHFYKGAPAINWAVYYPMELVMSYLTDCLITINDEDYRFAKKHFRHPVVEHVNGVGYDNSRFFPVTAEEKEKLRKEKGFSAEDKILIYVAEMNENKNQPMLFEALRNVPDAKLLIVGRDNLNGLFAKKAEAAGVDDRVLFLGHREDVEQLVKLSDICVASSIREGLPVNIMEAMACGLPVVASDNRGHRSLVKSGEDGYIVPVNDFDKMAEKVYFLLNDSEKYRTFSNNASENIKKYSKDNVLIQMNQIYDMLQR